MLFSFSGAPAAAFRIVSASAGGISDAAPLRCGVDAEHFLHRVAEIVEPHRRVAGAGEDIDDAAAHSELAGGLDLRHADKAGRQQAGGQRSYRERLSQLDAEGLFTQLPARDDRLHAGVGRGAYHLAAAAEQAAERQQARLFGLMRDAFHVDEHDIAADKGFGVKAETGKILGGAGGLAVVGKQRDDDRLLTAGVDGSQQRGHKGR